jgi:hypothetical protein
MVGYELYRVPRLFVNLRLHAFSQAFGIRSLARSLVSSFLLLLHLPGHSFVRMCAQYYGCSLMGLLGIRHALMHSEIVFDLPPTVWARFRVQARPNLLG